MIHPDQVQRLRIVFALVLEIVEGYAVPTLRIRGIG